MCHVEFDGSLHHCNSRRRNTIFILVCKNVHRFSEGLVGLHCKDVYVPSQSLYLLHESLCSMPNPLELLKSQLTACIEQALRLLAVKTFFCSALQLFSGGTHHFFQAQLIAVYCFGQLQPVCKNNALLWSFDGKFYNVQSAATFQCINILLY